MLSKPISRAAEKADKRRAQQKQQRAVYTEVTRRDLRRCRACGNFADPSALDMTRRGHHHHIRFRSAGGDDSTANVALLCAIDHADVHAHRLTVTGNADSILEFTREGKTWHS